MHGATFGLWCVLLDLDEREVIEDPFNLYMHHYNCDLAVLFEEQDFREGCTQMFEIFFKMARHIAKSYTNHKDFVDFWVLLRISMSKVRKQKYKVRNYPENRPKNLMEKYRHSAPRTHLPVPAFIINKYPEEWKLFFEIRILGSKFDFGNPQWKQDSNFWKWSGDAIIFLVGSGDEQLSNFKLFDSLGSYLGITVVKPVPAYQLVERRSDEEFYQLFLKFSLSIVQNEELKKFIFDHMNLNRIDKKNKYGTKRAEYIQRCNVILALIAVEREWSFNPSVIDKGDLFKDQSIPEPTVENYVATHGNFLYRCLSKYDSISGFGPRKAAKPMDESSVFKHVRHCRATGGTQFVSFSHDPLFCLFWFCRDYLRKGDDYGVIVQVDVQLVEPSRQSATSQPLTNAAGKPLLEVYDISNVDYHHHHRLDMDWLASIWAASARELLVRGWIPGHSIQNRVVIFPGSRWEAHLASQFPEEGGKHLPTSARKVPTSARNDSRSEILIGPEFLLFVQLGCLMEVIIVPFVLLACAFVLGTVAKPGSKKQKKTKEDKKQPSLVDKGFVRLGDPIDDTPRKRKRNARIEEEIEEEEIEQKTPGWHISGYSSNESDSDVEKQTQKKPVPTSTQTLTRSEKQKAYNQKRTCTTLSDNLHIKYVWLKRTEGVGFFCKDCFEQPLSRRPKDKLSRGSVATRADKCQEHESNVKHRNCVKLNLAAQKLRQQSLNGSVTITPEDELLARTVRSINLIAKKELSLTVLRDADCQWCGHVP
eukprot:Lithocolla_globosa_v1_NODE_316_length_4526_cov_4.454403.p1 type:complete len:761 gc:universal NODE_316_length_4526_cov_4.454403:125-2407(+)